MFRYPPFTEGGPTCIVIVSSTQFVLAFHVNSYCTTCTKRTLIYEGKNCNGPFYYFDHAIAII